MDWSCRAFPICQPTSWNASSIAGVRSERRCHFWRIEDPNLRHADSRAAHACGPY
jgi:hypothetical protein